MSYLKTNPNPIRYTVYLKGDPADEYYQNFTQYSTKMDKIKGYPSAFSQAIYTACHYLGIIEAEFSDGSREMIRDYR